jgi:exodeoxyribonuclease-1
MIFIYANYYFNFGFNITCIINERNEFNSHKDDNQILKSPSHKWENFKTERQDLGTLRSYAWHKAVGVGLVLGYGNLRALDVDKCTDLSIVHDFLSILELPLDYKWVVRSGSQEGFHILFYCENHKYKVAKNKIKAFKSSINYSNTFKHIELRWEGHLVLPPSIHPCLMNYQFMNGFPLKEPMVIKSSDLHKLLKKYCDNSSIKDKEFDQTKELLIPSYASEELDIFINLHSEFDQGKELLIPSYASEELDMFINLHSEMDKNQMELKYIDSIDVKGETFLFMDYETFNSKTKGGRASQYASLRTNSNLDLIKDNASNFFCEQIDDNIPSITASLITGLTPQKIMRFKSKEEHPNESIYCNDFHVYNEFNFIKNILKEMKKPSTCVLGYNSYSFDDEYTRNLAYRNLFDPYEREWENNNTRFDVYFLIWATYVLKPDLINFPSILPENGLESEVSFKLEHLTKENNIIHENAHDAFSDVIATIKLMKLIKTKDEEFFNSIFKFRKKINVENWLIANNITNNIKYPVSFIHINGIYGKQSNILALLCFICVHPTIKTRLICVRIDQRDIEGDLNRIILCLGKEIIDNIYSKSSVLKSKGEDRLPIAFIDVNKCPILAMKTEIEDYMFNDYLISNNLDSILVRLDDLKKKLSEAFNQPYIEEKSDSDLMLYSSFFNDREKSECIKNRNLADEGKFSEINCSIDSVKLKEMIFKFKARNFTKYLSISELHKWEIYRNNRISVKSFGAEIILVEFAEELKKWRSNDLTEKEIDLFNKEIIDEIEQWVYKLSIIVDPENEYKVLQAKLVIEQDKERKITQARIKATKDRLKALINAPVAAPTISAVDLES